MSIKVPCFIQKVMTILEKNGYESYLVGGCVRDFLMGKEPYDYDMTTNASPAEIKKCFEGFPVIETGLKHGTVTVVISGQRIEITTFRIDGQYEDNRHPSKVFFTGDLKEDLARRDFTVNAMAWGQKTGIVDLFGGKEHIESKTIACVGDADARFREDGLRILRALRFASVLGFTVEQKTADSIRANKSLLHNIAYERIYQELVKLICGASVATVIREFYEVICEFIPEIHGIINFNQNNKYHCYDVFTHTLAVVEHIEPQKILRLAALFHDIGKPHCYTEDENGMGHFYGHSKIGSEMTQNILKRLKADNHTIQTVAGLVLDHDRDFGETERPLKRFLAGCTPSYARLLMQLKKADTMGKDPKYISRIKKIENYEKIMERIYSENECISLKKLEINGHDLRTMGIIEGLLIGKILKKLLLKVIDGKIENNREMLLAEAKKIYFGLR